MVCEQTGQLRPLHTIMCFDCRTSINICHLIKERVAILISVCRGSHCSFSSGSDVAWLALQGGHVKTMVFI